MNEQEQLTTAFIELFPTLSPTDFPKINAQSSNSTWLMDWQSNYEASKQVIAACEFSNFGGLLEEKFKTLNVVTSSHYDVSYILKDIFNYIEKFEDNSEHELVDLSESEYDASFYDDDELSFEEQYAIAMDNITFDILQHDVSVIVIEHGESSAFILSQAAFEALSKLEKLLKTTYTNSDVTLYHHEYKQDYQFSYLLTDLE
ncbi:hypothetical protein [Acinetobacter sp. Marseille-Q1618]|uniref:hypothetical protein n=1 Tax=Acinetobacter sp. Marseille-Q1618 TaxID=2697502 RepID=UPI001570DBF6|nr:hypothetical protein [Acinetobacter sp. Marseille-Q1618]